jgi:hypothetical protein
MQEVILGFGGWFESGPQVSPVLRRQWRIALYALFLLLLVPTARFTPIQLSPLVRLWLLYAASGGGARERFVV